MAAALGDTFPRSTEHAKEELSLRQRWEVLGQGVDPECVHRARAALPSKRGQGKDFVLIVSASGRWEGRFPDKNQGDVFWKQDPGDH